MYDLLLIIALKVTITRNTMTARPFLTPMMIDCEGGHVIIETYSTKSPPQLLGIDKIVEAMPPALLCGLFKVYSKHSNTIVMHV